MLDIFGGNIDPAGVVWCHMYFHAFCSCGLWVQGLGPKPPQPISPINLQWKSPWPESDGYARCGTTAIADTMVALVKLQNESRSFGGVQGPLLFGTDSTTRNSDVCTWRASLWFVTQQQLETLASAEVKLPKDPKKHQKAPRSPERPQKPDNAPYLPQAMGTPTTTTATATKTITRTLCSRRRLGFGFRV